MTNIVCITMARMTSSRLPGKPMMKILGKPMLQYHIERLQKSQKIDKLVLATTTNKADDVLEELCLTLDVEVFRGSEDDVLQRYYQCAKKYRADVIVRVTGDCPLIDPILVDDVIDFYESEKCDYAHLDVCKFPRGFDCEVFNMSALQKTYNNAHTIHYREHVTPYIYENPKIFSLSSYTMEENFSDLRFCVDEVDDFSLISKIIEAFGQDIIYLSWREIVDYVNNTNELKNLNLSVKQRI